MLLMDRRRWLQSLTQSGLAVAQSPSRESRLFDFSYTDSAFGVTAHSSGLSGMAPARAALQPLTMQFASRSCRERCLRC